MRVFLGDEYIEFINDEAGVNELIKEIENKALATADKFFSHLVIDGLEVYDNYEGYIEDNIGDIRNISMEFLTISEYIKGILISTNEYLSRATPAVEGLADAFYQKADMDVWQELDNMLEGIEWLYETFIMIDSLPNLADVMPDYERWNLYSKVVRELQEVMPNLQEPLESGDYVLVADIILYELRPILEKMRSNIPVVE